ncbi:MAG: hypothetical protein AAAB11_07755 [Rhizobium giardinii]
MKTPQRNFVVEYRSGRRQSKVQANSIWGDTDLKALAREVENKAPHLFQSNEAAGRLGDARDMPPDLRSDSGDGRNADGARSAASEPEKQRGAVLPRAEPVALAQESHPVVPQRRRASRGASGKHAERSPVRVVVDFTIGMNEEGTLQTLIAPDPDCFDDLTALDAENRRLKKLLAEQLCAENAKLTKMLERFDFT